MYLALDICCLPLLLWSIGKCPDSTGPTRLTLMDKMFQELEKLVQLTPEQQKGQYLLLVILLIRSMFQSNTTPSFPRWKQDSGPPIST